MNNKIKVGIAPLTWTNDDLPELGGEITFEQCIFEMSQAGYEGCEIGNKFPKDPQVLLSALKPHQLQVASQWCSLYFTQVDGYQQTIQDFRERLLFLKSVGADIIVVSEQGGSIQGKEIALTLENKPVFDTPQWEQLFNGLHEIGQIAKDHNMKMAYHHHMGTGVQTINELDYLMENTESLLVDLVFDTGHLCYAGIDPLMILEKYINRIAHIHLKDLRFDKIKQVSSSKLSFLDGVKMGTFTVPGDGDIDFQPIMQKLLNSCYHGWLIVEAEQDPAIAHPLTYATMGREYIAKFI